MLKQGRLSFGILVTLTLADLCVAQERALAEGLLHKAAEAYENLGAFHFEATEVTLTRSKDFERKMEARFVTTQDAAGRWRVEFDNGVTSGVGVFDGETSWTYSPEQKQYTQRRAGSPDDQADPEGVDFKRMRQYFPSRYRALGKRIKSAEIVREETIEVGGRSVPCTVVRAEYDAPPGAAEGTIERTYWIGREEPLVLREVSEAQMTAPGQERSLEITQTISFRAAEVNKGLPDHLFVFQPPADARLVDSLSPQAPEEGLVGQLAPDFTLRDLTGRPFRLQDQRGKIVLLDFWASWCAPCRVDLPRIEAIHREWKSKELVVWGINSESPDVAREFLRGQSYTFPTLVDADQRLGRQYQVTAIPTVVVIGKDGKVAAYLMGSHPEAELREVILKAGLADNPAPERP